MRNTPKVPRSAKPMTARSLANHAEAERVDVALADARILASETANKHSPIHMLVDQLLPI